MAVVLNSTSTTVATGFLPINGYDGSGTYNNTDIAGGGIIRVKKTVYNTPTTFTGALDVTHSLNSLFSVSLTPTSTSSRFLINCRFAGEIQQSYNFMFHVMRKIGTGSFASITTPTVSPENRNFGLIAPGESYAVNGVNFSTTPCGADYWWMDSPGTTSTVEYALGYRSSGGSTTIYINRTRTDQADTSERMSSSIMVMEVTG